ncbi:MAG: sigma-70 family RNA polymerase sigma factor [Ignavibacteriae bacterium]|nr:sigma-70 family RNA polymerase sigma factor [Ignavibacteriota bacterium]
MIHKAIQGIPKNLTDYDSQFSIANTVLLSSINYDFNFHSKIKFTTYCIWLIRFRIIDVIRKVKINYEYSDEINFTSENIEFFDEMENNEIYKMMIDLIPKLGRTQQIIMGCKLQGMSNKFIAKSADVSEGLISQHYKNGLLQLRKLMFKFL